MTKAELISARDDFAAQAEQFAVENGQLRDRLRCREGELARFTADRSALLAMCKLAAERLRDDGYPVEQGSTVARLRYTISQCEKAAL